MTLRAVLFDFDDTLVDTSSSRQERARRAHQRLLDAGHSVRWSAFWHSLNALDVDGFYSRGMRPVIRDLGLEGTALGDECIGLWFFRGCEDLMSFMPGCPGILDDLARNYRLGVITNGAEDVQKHKFAHTGLAPYFDVFLPSGEVGVHKPEPRIFRIALERMGVAPHEAVFIGDHLDLDVIGAQRAGMKAIWYAGPGKRPDDPYIVPDALVHHLRELPAVLARL